MARRCGICRLAPRVSDPMGTVFVQPDNPYGVAPGHYMACSECCDKHEPGGRYGAISLAIGVGYNYVGTPPNYGSMNAGVLDDAPAWLCGVCRRFAREDDSMEALRLYQEDAPERPDLFPEPLNNAECYMACSECRRHYGPRILARLQRDGLAPLGLRSDCLPAGMYL